ncbi:MAG: hypothetical protein MHPSP_000500 [Paramarteilia canceri]
MLLQFVLFIIGQSHLSADSSKPSYSEHSKFYVLKVTPEDFRYTICPCYTELKLEKSVYFCPHTTDDCYCAVNGSSTEVIPLINPQEPDIVYPFHLTSKYSKMNFKISTAAFAVPLIIAVLELITCWILSHGQISKIKASMKEYYRLINKILNKEVNINKEAAAYGDSQVILKGFNIRTTIDETESESVFGSLNSNLSYKSINALNSK